MRPWWRDERGTFGKRMQCFYHLWTYDLEGQCTGITRPEGYEPVGHDKENVSLRPVRTEIFGGLVFVSIEDDVVPLEQFLGPMADHLRLHLPEDEPLEVFHYHRAEIRANWKLWVDNDSEQYHEYLHILNRKTGLTQPNYHERRWHLYPGSHNVIDQLAIGYGEANLEARSEGLMPGVEPDAILVMTLFPDVMINVRATVMRIDTLTPVAPDRTIVEWRGLGLKSDSEEQREDRARHHNQVWGPAGRNLPEDVAAGRIATGRNGRRRPSAIPSMPARRNCGRTMIQICARSTRNGAAGSADGRTIPTPTVATSRRLRWWEVPQSDGASAAEDREAIRTLISRSARLMDSKQYDDYMALYAADGAYALQADSDEIGQRMTWLKMGRDELAALLEESPQHVHDTAARTHMVFGR